MSHHFWGATTLEVANTHTTWAILLKKIFRTCFCYKRWLLMTECHDLRDLSSTMKCHHFIKGVNCKLGFANSHEMQSLLDTGPKGQCPTVCKCKEKLQTHTKAYKIGCKCKCHSPTQPNTTWLQVLNIIDVLLQHGLHT